MKILFVSNLFPDESEPNRGRVNAVMLRELAKQAEVRVVGIRPALGKSGLVALNALPEDRHLQPEYVRVPYIPKVGSAVNHRLYARALGPHLRRIVESWKPDVVLASWLYPDACAVSRICTALKVPLVAIAQGSDVHGYLENPVRRRLILDLVDNRAKAVITRSPELAERLIAAGAVSKHLYPIQNGVDHTIFHPVKDRAALRQELGVPSKAPLVLFVGNFLPVKDPATLAAGFEIVAHAFPNAILALCGDGPLRRQTAKDLDHAELLGHCRFEGTVDASTVARWMQAADLLVLTSLQEGTPNVILETLSCGTPVVATAVGGVPELIVDATLGRTIPPRDPHALATAVAAILHDPPDRTLIAEHAEYFHWDVTVSSLLEVIGQ